MAHKENNQNTSQNLVKPILELFADGKIQDALDASKKLRKMHPNDPLLLNIIGACQAEKNEFDQAIGSYKEALEMNPNYAKAHYNLAAVFHKTGVLKKAILSYERAIDIDPNFAEAINNLGAVYVDLNEEEKASSCFKKATKIKPNYLEPFISLGILNQNMGETSEAILHFEAALALDPFIFEVHNNLGVLFETMGQINDAESHFRKALSINPNLAEAYQNLGNIYKDQGEFNKAIEEYENALMLDPRSAATNYNLGVVYHELHELESAVSCYQTALKVDADFIDAHLSLGVALQDLGKFTDATKTYKNALSINPMDAHIHFNLAIALNKLGDSYEAIKSYKNALSLKPDMAEAHNNIGNIFNDNGHFDEAIKSYRNAIDFAPNYAEAYHHLGSVLSEVGEFEKAIDSFDNAIAINPKLNFILGQALSSRMQLCLWDSFSKNIDVILSGINNNEAPISPFALLSIIDDPKIQRKVAEIYSSKKFPKKNDLSKLEYQSKNVKIKVGYFSADFRDHAVSYLTAGLFELHDRACFEIHAFSFGKDTNDIMNLRIKAGVDCFHEVCSLKSQEIVDLARSLEIDIAVDLSGYTSGARTEIFASLVAPIQLSYIGYLGTMGADYYDYLIADSIIIPIDSEKYYSEKIVYLPSFQANDSLDTPPDIFLTRKDVGLPEDKFVFCCFNNTYKFNPKIFDSWSRILSKTPESVLIVYASNEQSKANLTKEIVKRGIDSSRLIFADNLDRPYYLARYRVADLFLDTHPYNAGTTASDAIKMGLPVLTFIGSSYQARMGASILNAANMPELITNSIGEYESLAIELANNPQKLKDIKKKLLDNISIAPLYDTNLFTKGLESAYKKMYERNQRALEPENITIGNL